MFNYTPSDTLKVVFLQQNTLLSFINIHEKCVLYRLKIFISTIHWCCQQNIIYSVNYFRICISESFMRPCFFLPPFNRLEIHSPILPQVSSLILRLRLNRLSRLNRQNRLNKLIRLNTLN